MAVKLFILGLPGSGKSTIAREIEKYISGIGLKSTRICDFVILEQMFHDDVEHKQFRPAAKGGFDVLDFTAFDTALKLLERTTKQYILTSKSEEIILIEFARNNYQSAFHQFSQEFLQDAYFLYLKVDVEICKRRICERINYPITPDDHYVSEYIFGTYYFRDDGQDISNILEKDYKIEKDRVLVIDNNSSMEEALSQIGGFIGSVSPSDVQKRLLSMQA